MTESKPSTIEPGPLQTAGARVEVTPVTSRDDRRAFVALPYDAYRGVPHWRAPLRFERNAQIDPAHNPGLAALDHVLMLARRDGAVVGRIAATINPAHLDLYGDATGHFGFLDTLRPDPEAVAALTEAACAWLRARGIRRVTGPFNFTINEETGLLVDGFDSPPMIMMPHGRPDYAPALEAQGFAKAMDMFALFHRFGPTYEIPPRVTRMVDAFDRDPQLGLRPLDMKNFAADIALVMDMFNDAWSQNWGFVPFSSTQINAMARELKPLMKPDSLWIATIGGEPAAFTLFLPDINEIADGLDGRLLPLGWLQLLYRLKLRGATRARTPLGGLRRRYHKTWRGVLAVTKTFEVGARSQHARGVREIEASWILETNTDLLNMLDLYGMKPYKTYRVYEKAL